MKDNLYKVSVEVFVYAKSEKEAIQLGKKDLVEAIEGKHPSSYIETEEVEQD